MMNRPRSGLWLTAAALVAVLVGVGAWLAVRGGGTTSQPGVETSQPPLETTTQPPVTQPPVETATTQPRLQAPPVQGAAATSPAATTSSPTATTSSSTPPQAAAPRSASEAELISLARALGHPIYWAGPEKGDTYELTRTSSGSVYVSYLPPGVKIGAAGAAYLIVATYPIPGAFAAIKRQASSGGPGVIRLAGGGLALVDAGDPKSVHVAFPGSELEVEVFDPSPARARQVVSSGRLSALG